MSEPTTTGTGCGCGGYGGEEERAGAPVVEPVDAGPRGGTARDGVSGRDAAPSTRTGAALASGKPGNDLGLRAAPAARAGSGHGCGCGGHGRGHGRGGSCGCSGH